MSLFFLFGNRQQTIHIPLDGIHLFCLGADFLILPILLLFFHGEGIPLYLQGGGILYQQANISYPLFLIFDGGQQSVLGSYHLIPFSLQLLIVGDTMFYEEIERLGCLFEIVDFRPMCKANALLGFQVVLNINEQVYLFVSGLWLSGWA